MKNFFLKLVGTNSLVSSKRFITIAAFIMMCIGFLFNLFFGLTISENIYSAMEYIVIAGLGFTASERFSKTPTIPTVAEPTGEPDADKPQ